MSSIPTTSASCTQPTFLALKAVTSRDCGRVRPSVQAEPVARGPLRLGDLPRRHLAGDLLPVQRRLAVAADRGEVEPFVRGDEVGGDLPSGRVENAELEEALIDLLAFGDRK